MKKCILVILLILTLFSSFPFSSSVSAEEENPRIFSTNNPK